MNNLEIPFNLKQMLECCADSSPKNRELGWRIFLKRFKGFMYKVIENRCQHWNNDRLGQQLSETVNDIIIEVLQALFENEARVLKGFENVHDERKFLTWLALLSNSRSIVYLKKYYPSERYRKDQSDPEKDIPSLEMDKRWESYDSIVAALRDSFTRERKTRERDIHIFMLSEWADFSPHMISSMDPYRSMNNNHIYTLIGRLRRLLKKKLEKIEIFLFLLYKKAGQNASIV